MKSKLLAVVILALVAAACAPTTDETTFPSALSGTSGAGVSSATVAGTTATSSAWIATVPRLATPGQQVAVTGQGFDSGEAVAITLFDSDGQALEDPFFSPADARGALANTPIPIPATLGAGAYTVEARGRGSQRAASTIVWLQSTAPAVDLSTPSARPEQRITITARGFVPGERIVVYFAGLGGDPLTALSADQKGTARADNVSLPILPPGRQRIVVVGGVSAAQASHDFDLLPFDPVVALNATTVPPGELVGFFGSGFAARDQIQITLDGSTEPQLVVQTDDRGRLVAPEAFRLPTSLKGPQTFVVRAARTDTAKRLAFQVVPSYPLIELSSYFGAAGSDVGLALRYLRPRERVDVYVGEGGQRKKLATFRADDNGWLPAEARFVIPANMSAGSMIVSLDGEASRPPMRAKFTVTP